MRLASILAATAAISWLFGTLWDLPVSRWLLLYTGWLFVVTTVAVFVAPRIPQNDKSYAIFYAVMLGPLLLFVILAAIDFGVSLGGHGITGFVIFAFLAAWFVRLFSDHVPNSFVSKVMLTQGYFFLVAGLLSIASLVPPCGALQFRLRLTLGLYWLAVAAYSFAQSLGVVRAKALFMSIDSWFAGALCVVFLGGLAWALQGIQTELGPQHHRDEAPADLVWEES